VLAWASAGLGAVSLGVGIWATATRFERRDEYDLSCPSGYAVARMPGCNAALDRVSDASVVVPQVAGFVVAGALAVTSAVLFVTAPTREPSARAVACGPGPGTLGVGCALRF